MCWPHTGQAYLNSLMVRRNISYFKAGGNGHFHDFGGVDRLRGAVVCAQHTSRSMPYEGGAPCSRAGRAILSAAAGLRHSRAPCVSRFMVSLHSKKSKGALEEPVATGCIHALFLILAVVATARMASGAATAVTARAERAEHARYNVQPHRLRRWTRRGQRSALSLPRNRVFCD